MNPARIAVLVSGNGTNLEQLLLAAEAGRLPHGSIALVVSNKPGVYSLERAANHGVAAQVVVSAGRKQEEFEAELTALLAEWEIDLLVLAGFLRVLSADFVARWPERIINVHPSLIPAFCGDGYYGLRVHQAALERGVRLSGATVHLVNEITDGGRILLQKAVEVLEDDTPESLQQRVMRQAEWQLLPQAVEMIAARVVREKEELTINTVIEEDDHD